MPYYIQTSEMKYLINWDVLHLPRYAGGHDEQMQQLFRDSEVISHWKEGDYQGTVATLVRLKDGRAVLYNDFYGSCSGCDAWENASDDSARAMCINLANNAYVFPCVQAAILWLRKMAAGMSPDSYRWRNRSYTDGLLANLRPCEANNSESAKFWHRMHENPKDESVRAVFSDWCEEQGDMATAEYLRSLERP